MVLGPQPGKRSSGEYPKGTLIIVKSQRSLVVFATGSVEFLRQAMMDYASPCRWTEDNNVAFAHVQPPFFCVA